MHSKHLPALCEIMTLWCQRCTDPLGNGGTASQDPLGNGGNARQDPLGNGGNARQDPLPSGIEVRTDPVSRSKLRFGINIGTRQRFSRKTESTKGQLYGRSEGTTEKSRVRKTGCSS